MPLYGMGSTPMVYLPARWQSSRELLGGVLDGVGLHEAAVYVVDAEEVAHVEADLLLVHLLVAAVVLSPEGDVLDLGDGDVVLLEDGEDVLVVQALGEGVDIGLGAQADALEAGGLGGGDALFKLALVAERPGADGQRMIFGHFCFLPKFFSGIGFGLGPLEVLVEARVQDDCEDDADDGDDDVEDHDEHQVLIRGTFLEGLTLAIRN